MSDNISAISTALGASGVAVIRMSGDSPLEIAKKMFKPSGKVEVKDFVPNVMYPGEIDCGGFFDYGMCVYFKGPKSFTGEDSVEFHCHGGIAITRGVLLRTIELGARLANNGEFTKRAFINGKLSLSSAEGLIDMINGESVATAKAGYYLYREKLTKEVENLQDKLLDAISEIDADMDFPEEDLETASREAVKGALIEVKERIGYFLSTYRTGRSVVSGVKVGIVGKPNTGKSSILNALLAYDKAIVSDVPGTTRDIVEGSLEINGVKFNFSDTAGIRESDDEIESLGVLLSKKILDESDLLIFVLDSSNIDKTDLEIKSLIEGKNVLTVLNKKDKCDRDFEGADLKISAKEKINLEKLRSKIFEKTIGDGIDVNGDFLCEERHFDAMKRAEKKIEEALLGIDVVSTDMLAVDVKGAWDALGEISGKTATEDIINNIFAKFCVGK